MKTTKNQRRLALLLCVAMITVQLPVTAAASVIAKDGEIAAFTTLEKGIRTQTVPVGTEESELELPEKLTAKVCRVSEDAVISDRDSEDIPTASPSEAGELGTSPEWNPAKGSGALVTTVTTEEISVPVTWNSEPGYDGERRGTYVFTADVDGYFLADGVKPPKITVTVEENSDTILPIKEVRSITDWEWIEPDEGLVDGCFSIPGVNPDHQLSLENLAAMLPKKISASLSKNASGSNAENPVEIKLTGWGCDTYVQDKNKDWPVLGEYLFTAGLPEGYALVGGAKRLEITVVLGGANVLTDTGTGDFILTSNETLDTSDYTYDETSYTLTIKSSKPITISMKNGVPTTTQDHIAVASGITANITLDNVNIDVRGTSGVCPFHISDNADVILILKGKNVLQSEDQAGIHVPGDSGEAMTAAALTIKCSDHEDGHCTDTCPSLTVFVNSCNNATRAGAGIGGQNFQGPSGTITIEGGVIHATGSERGAGIGGCWDGATGDITITGGMVTATGNGGGAGIGGGSGGTGGNITITDGTVTATSNNPSRWETTGIGGMWESGDAGTINITGGIITATGSSGGSGIGGGEEVTKGNITISGCTVTANGIGTGAGSNIKTSIEDGAVVICNSGSINKDDQSNWSGFVLADKEAKVYGLSAAIKIDVNIPEDTTLTLESNQTLSIQNAILTNKGTITTHGTLTLEGNASFINEGETTIGENSTLTGALQDNTGKITVNGKLILKKTSASTNTGTVTVNGEVILEDDVTLVNNNSNNKKGEITVGENGTLSGNGKLKNNSTMNVSGKVTAAMDSTVGVIYLTGTGSVPSETVGLIINKSNPDNFVLTPTNEEDTLTAEDYSFENNTLTIKSGKPITISMPPDTVAFSQKTIKVAAGVEAHMTWNALRVSNDTKNLEMLTLADYATANITLKGTSNVYGYLFIPEHATLVFTEESTGNLIIKGNALDYRSVIGGTGLYENVGKIYIKGGKISAEVLSGYAISVIGPGQKGGINTIKISGGTVEASSAYNGSYSIHGTLSWGEGGDAVVIVNQALEAETSRNGWSVFLIEAGHARIYGAQTLRSDFTVDRALAASENSAEEMTINQEDTLTIPEGSTLTVNSTLTIKGTLVVKGTLINNGTIVNEGVIDKYGSIGGSSETDGTIRDSSVAAVTFSQDTVAYGDEVVITAAIAKKNANEISRSAALNTVDFYLGGVSDGILLGTKDIKTDNGKTTAALTVTKEVWEKGGANWTIDGSGNTITADFGGTSALADSTAAAILMVSKASQAKPDAPEQSGEATAASITISTVEGQKYLCTADSSKPEISSGNWQDGNGSLKTFDSLASNTTYYIWTYIPGTNYYLDSPVSSSLSVTTDKSGDQKAVERAKEIIGNVTYMIRQDMANTEEAVKAELARQMNALSGMSDTGITVTEDDVTITADSFQAAIAGDADTPEGADGKYSFTVSLSKGQARATTDSKGGTITATAFTGLTNAQAVANAKKAIERGIYTIAQATANAEDTVKAELASQINALFDMSGTGITVTADNITITAGSFQAAKAGDADELKGKDGKYSFTVSLSKGQARVTTDSKGGTITATAFTGLTNAQAVTDAKKVIENGTYSMEQAMANTEDAVKAELARQMNALSGMSDTGITVTADDVTITAGSFQAAKVGDADTPKGTNGKYSFTVSLSKGKASDITTSQDGTITATSFTGLTNVQAVADAKKTIENGSYSMEQTIANTEDTVKAELARQMNTLSGMNNTGINVTADHITIMTNSFQAAKAGDADTPKGTNGKFSFTVSLTKGKASDITTSQDGTITATSFTGLTNVQAVADAKKAIENGSYSMEQTIANTEDTVKAELASRINALSDMNDTGITVTADHITITTNSFQAAKAGDADTPKGANGKFSFTVLLSKGKASDITSSKVGAIIAISFTGLTNVQAVADAKKAIESGFYTISQATANTEDTVKAELASKINALSDMNGTGITVTADNVMITANSFQAAKAGDADTPKGTNGKFSFTVSLSKGKASDIATSQDGTITATSFTGLTNVQAVADAKKAVENGSYSMEQTIANTEEAVKTELARQMNALSGMNNTGINVTADHITITANSFQAAKAGDADTPEGTNGKYSFTVSLTKGQARATTVSQDGAIMATSFIGLTNVQAVADAKKAIESGFYTISQATANTEDTVKAELASQINALSDMSGTGITVTADNVMITANSFQAAKAGDADTPKGTNGKFSFTVLLSKGKASDITSSKVGAITAISFTGLTNVQAVADAKKAVENGSYSMEQTIANTEDTVKAELARQMNTLSGMNNTGINVTADHITITANSFQAAKAGDADTPKGTNGKFSFTVSLSKGKASDITASQDGTIMATSFTGLTNVQAVADAKKAVENGSYSMEQTIANTEEAVKAELARQMNALSGMNNTGINVTADHITIKANGFQAAKAGDADTPEGTNGKFSFTVSLTKGQARATTASQDGTIMATSFTGLTNVQAVADAKKAIENGTYTISQATANTKDTVKAELASQINALSDMSGTGISLTADDIAITAGNFQAAIAGDANDPKGTDGKYSFTASLSKGRASDITSSKGGTITAMHFEGQTNAEAVTAAKTAIESGIYTVEQATANSEDAVKAELAGQMNALSGMSGTGITVTANHITMISNSFHAAKAGDADEPIGTNGKYRFTVLLTKGQARATTASQDGIITATAFTGLTNAQAVENAKTAIESGIYTVEQAAANTEDTVRAELVRQMNALPGMSGTGITVTADHITIGEGFNAAIAGNVSGRTGIDGSFSFTVFLTKSKAAATTSSKGGVITATPYKAPNIITDILPGGKVGNTYVAELKAAGDAPITWSIMGSMPDGLILSGDTISGTPTASGDFTFTVQASNGYMPNAEKTLTIKIADRSSDAALSALSLDNVALSPAFDPDITDYTASVVYETTGVTIAATADGTGSKVYEGIGYKPLNTGKNTVVVTVIAENGTRKSYTITITRAAYSGGGNTTGTIILPPKKTDIPATGEIAANPNEPITSGQIREALDKAAAESKANGLKNNGLAVAVTLQGGTASITLDRDALDELISFGVKNFKVSFSNMVSMTFSIDNLKEIAKQSSGTVTFAADKAAVTGEALTVIGTRPAYDLSISFRQNGQTVKLSNVGSVAVTLFYITGTGEQDGTLYAVCADDGNAVWLDKSSYDKNAKAILFTAEHFSLYGIGYKAPPVFNDTVGHWAKSDIDFAVARGLLSGTTAATFSPNAPVTRGMFAAALGQLAGINPADYASSSRFIDVPATEYYAPYVEWAAAKGIMSGTGHQTFEPGQGVTREEMAATMQRYAKMLGDILPVTREAENFTDTGQISTGFQTAVQAIQQAGIMNGKNNHRFGPRDMATRAEAAAVLRRYVEIMIAPSSAGGWTQNDSGEWLYYENNKPVTGWKQIENKWYYFYAAGVMAINTKVDGHEIGPDGARKDEI